MQSKSMQCTRIFNCLATKKLHSKLLEQSVQYKYMADNFQRKMFNILTTKCSVQKSSAKHFNHKIVSKISSVQNVQQRVFSAKFSKPEHLPNHANILPLKSWDFSLIYRLNTCTIRTLHFSQLSSLFFTSNK